MQVLVPSILTKPAPYSAQALAELGRFSRKRLAGWCGLVGLLKTGLLGTRGNRSQRHRKHDQEGFSHPAFYRRLADPCQD
jgi:hypothetical protein